MSLIRKAFKRLHYPVDIILSLRNLEEMMTERGIRVDHSPLYRWVIRLTPLLGKAFRRHKRPVARGWCMGETYIKIKGQWKYLYRAVIPPVNLLIFLLTANRDTAAALRFFRKALRHYGEPDIITLDKSGDNTAAIALLNTHNLKIRYCHRQRCFIDWLNKE
ncbi:transposase (fragment) [Xenorhabdus bovienii str. Jollieti]|uniref:Transposase n=1 Tax=Xenorhabdus bovienii (strain SS-2004) TaxID=406818 RepID=D3UZI8_XENBS